MENVELYIMAVLIVVLIGLIIHTLRYYRGEKQKLKNLHRFAKEGEEDAQHRLAKHYEDGNMVKKDSNKAAFWYRRSSFTADEKAKDALDDLMEP